MRSSQGARLIEAIAQLAEEQKFEEIGHCGCSCHYPGSNMIHFVPCCYPKPRVKPEIKEDDDISTDK